MSDTATLDLFTETEARDAALSRHEETACFELRLARAKAMEFCLKDKGFEKYGIHHSITADDVRSMLSLAPLDNAKNSWMGSVFRKGYHFSGRYHKSATPGSHGNELKIWVLK